MAESGDPPPSDDRAPVKATPGHHTPGDHSHDDLIGFTSAASLASARRETSATPASDPDPAPFPEEAEQAGLFDAPVNRLAAMRAQRTAPAPAPTPATAWAGDDGASIPPAAPVQNQVQGPFGRASAIKPAPFDGVEGAMGLFAVYALILFAVPTLGVAAAVALIAVLVRPRPEQAVARSHFDFQKRTLWIAAVAAMVGVVLILVNLGVFVLFFVAVWLLLRGAWGLLLLARGEAIARPRQWLIAAR